MRIFKSFFIRINVFCTKIINTIRLLSLNKETYLFVQMAVKWKGLHLIKHNFGDDLNVYLFEELTGKRVLKYDEFFHLSRINCLGIGSILEWCSNRYSIVWGSGAMYGEEIKPIKVLKVHALRGKYTKRYLEGLGISCPNIFGDPALLLPLIYKPTNIKKKYKYGVVPHFVDFNLPHVSSFRINHPEILFIDLHDYNDWHDVIIDFLSCENILSSSLHGLIISDAYGIPNVHVKFSNLILGGNFKFKDYYSGIGRVYKDPLDFCYFTDVSQAEAALKDYTPIDFNPIELLSAFPFQLSSKYSYLLK